MKPALLFCIGRPHNSHEAAVFDVVANQLGDRFDVTQIVSVKPGDAVPSALPQVPLENVAESAALFDRLRPVFSLFYEGDLEANAGARRTAQERGVPYVVFVPRSPVSSISQHPQLAGFYSRQYREAAAVFAGSSQVASELRTYLGVPAASISVVTAAETLPARLLELITAKFPATAAESFATGVQSVDMETRVSPAWVEGDTTVLIPTANRPDMLRTALAGIRDQSARRRIREILVSENTTDQRSLDVCREFAAYLPIRHVQRRPPIAPLTHAKVICGVLYDTEFVAILHDDDWWLPEHLERSLRTLEREQTVGAYSSFVEVSDERSLPKGDNNVMIAFAAGFPPLGESWRLDSETVLLSCLPGTPGRYSTLVVRASAMVKAACIFDLDNCFDNDRMLTVALAKQGPLSFLPFPSVCIRMHANQDGRRYAAPALIDRVTQTTAWLLQQADAMRVDLFSVLQNRLEKCPTHSLEASVICYSQVWVRALLRNHPRTPAVLKEVWQRLERAQVQSKVA